VIRKEESEVSIKTVSCRWT